MTGSPHAICVVLPRMVTDSFIAHEIVQRLELRPRKDLSLAKPLLWGSTELISTGESVELSYTSSGSIHNSAHRFHVVENCPFDLLIGQELASNQVLKRDNYREIPAPC